MTYLIYSLLVFCCCISLLNFYLSFLRNPIHRLLGGAPDDYHWVSGFPVVGSLFIVLSLVLMQTNSWPLWLGIICAALDTGGLHWFGGAMLVMAARGKL